MDEDKIKHLEFLENCISRMNTCSFQLKAMCIGIVAALLAVFAAGISIKDNDNSLFVLIAIAPTIMFWILDSYYLATEKNFIKAYNIVAGLDDAQIMIKPFEIKSKLPKPYNMGIRNVIFTRAEVGLYGPIILFLVCIFLIVNCR